MVGKIDEVSNWQVRALVEVEEPAGAGLEVPPPPTAPAGNPSAGNSAGSSGASAAASPGVVSLPSQQPAFLGNK